MDIATIVGVVSAFGLVLTAIFMGGGLNIFINVPALMIVVGGTVGVLLFQFDLATFFSTFVLVLRSYISNPIKYLNPTIEELDEAIITGKSIRELRDGQEIEGELLNDIVFNMPHQPGLIGSLMRYATRSTGGPVISRVSRLLLVRQPQALKAWLLEQAERSDLCRLIVSHHEMVSVRPGEVLRRVAEAL